MLKSNMILRPLINEKSMALKSKDLYTFQVGSRATKDTISKMVKERFKVDVLSVKTLNVKPKKRMQRTRKGYFQTPATKKAVVKVKKGQKIAIFEEAQPEQDVEVRTAEGEKVAEVKEKKSLLRGTKVKIEKSDRGQQDLKESHKESKKKGK